MTPDGWKQALPRVLAVTADEMVATASDVLRPENRAVVTFVPELDPAGEVAA